MKITDFRYYPTFLQLKRPLVTARGRLDVRKGYVLGVQDAEGRWGVGEAAPLEAFGSEPLSRTRQTLATWARELPGKPVVWQPEADGLPPAAFGVLESAGPAPAARHALEMALLDLLGQEQQVPLACLLGASAPAEVAAQALAVNGLIGAEAPEEAAAQALALAAQGFGTLKIKLSGGEAQSTADLARVRAVRQAVGPNLRLRVDVGGGWQQDQALAQMEALAPLGLEYVEQPLGPEAWQGMTQLTLRAPIRVAADEMAATPEGLRRVLDERAAQVVILKPMVLGGVLTALRMARLADGRGIATVVTSSLEGVYGRHAALHLALALRQLPMVRQMDYACGLATGGLLVQDHLPMPPEPKAGCLSITAAPGLGLPGNFAQA